MEAVGGYFQVMGSYLPWFMHFLRTSPYVPHLLPIPEHYASRSSHLLTFGLVLRRGDGFLRVRGGRSSV